MVTAMLSGTLKHREPEPLEVYIKYEYLTSYDLSRVLSRLSWLLRAAYMRYPGFDSRYEPSLWVEEIHTGDSIRLKFIEGWIPRASTNEEGVVLELTKPLGLTVLMAALLLNGAEKVLNIEKGYIEVQKDKVELVLKQEEARKILQSPHAPALQQEAGSIVQFISDNPAFRNVEINGARIKETPPDR
jgi:hypothetical protein